MSCYLTRRMEKQNTNMTDEIIGNSNASSVTLYFPFCTGNKSKFTVSSHEYATIAKRYFMIR